MYSDTFHFYEGERKEITATVSPKNENEVVVITSATFELERVSDKTVIQTDNCEISGNEISMLLEVDTAGIFGLTMTAYVGKEVVKKTALIKVHRP